MPKSMTKYAKKKAREYLGSRNGWMCFYCGKKLIPDGQIEDFSTKIVIDGETNYTPIDGYDFPTVDHVIPLVAGGSNKIENIVLSCHHCNSTKGVKYG